MGWFHIYCHCAKICLKYATVYLYHEIHKLFSPHKRFFIKMGAFGGFFFKGVLYLNAIKFAAKVRFYFDVYFLF